MANQAPTLSLAELEAQAAKLTAEIDAMAAAIAAIGDAAALASVKTKLERDRARVQKQIKSKAALQFRDVIVLADNASEDQIVAARKIAATQVYVADDMPPIASLPFGDCMPNAALGTGIFSAQDRASLAKHSSFDVGHTNKLFPIEGRPNDYVLYSGPVLTIEDRDVALAVVGFASKAGALGAVPDQAGTVSGVNALTLSARQIAEATKRNYSTSARRLVIECLLQLNSVKLAIVTFAPGQVPRVADALRIAKFTNLIHVIEINQDPQAGKSEIKLSVPHSIVALYGYQDFSKVEMHTGLPPLVGFLRDYLRPHQDGYTLKASKIYKASQSFGKFAHFQRRLHDAFAWFVANGYVVEKRALAEDLEAPDEEAIPGYPVEHFQFRISKPTAKPAARNVSQSIKRSGQWYSYFPRTRRTKAEMQALH
ncbi:hypothetical protein [Dechloromonas hortensis]|uniref:hypothetical protein n=1 Tax=Dechloromonas hortensis TaxID=337779 RepID=UPI001290AD0D|nr:hypothetical protein [Dechloromonas hortensis]